MPWYIRKSLTRGPFRLNVSKRGLGASFGVKGLRIGVGPKGTYVAGGRGGLYYRQYLNAQTRPDSAVPVPSHAGVLPPTEATEFLGVSATDDEVAAEINQRFNELRWSVWARASAFIVPLLLVFSHFYILAALLFVTLLAYGVWLADRERKRRIINLTYNLPEVIGKYHDEFVKAFEAAAACSAIWRITSQTASRAKYTAGAENTVSRSLTSITFNDPTLNVSIRIPWLWVAGGKLAMLPDRMLFFGNRKVSALSYKDASVAVSLVNFREDGCVPGDSTNVGVTWQFVNKNGGPDRRFSNNRQIPIQRYSNLAFTHPQLTFQLEFSRVAAAQALKVAIDGLVAVDSSVSWKAEAANKSGGSEPEVSQGGPELPPAGKHNRLP